MTNQSDEINRRAKQYLYCYNQALGRHFDYVLKREQQHNKTQFAFDPTKFVGAINRLETIGQDFATATISVAAHLPEERFREFLSYAINGKTAEGNPRANPATLVAQPTFSLGKWWILYIPTFPGFNLWPWIWSKSDATTNSSMEELLREKWWDIDLSVLPRM